VPDLTDLERDTLAEVGNISLGSSATALSVLLNREVQITTPRLEVLEMSEIQLDYPLPCLAVEVDYTVGLEGSNLLLIKESDAIIIAALMMNEPYEGKEGPMGEIEQSAVQEAMNQMMGSMATSMAELFMRPIDISPPQVERYDLSKEKFTIQGYEADSMFVRVEFNMLVEDIIDSVMVQIIPIEFAKTMTGYLLPGASDSAPAPEQDSLSGSEAVPEDLHVTEEIDHTGGPEISAESSIETSFSEPGSVGLSDLEKDTISEVGNISLGSSATALSVLLNKSVDITTPKLEIIKVGEIQKKYPVPCLLVEVDYTVGLKGSNVLLVKESDALIIAALMMGEEPVGKEGPLTEIEMSAVQESMNQMMGSMATSMSELFQRTIDISPPRVEMIDLTNNRVMLGDLNPEDDIVHVAFSIKVEDIIDSVMVQVIPIEFAREMAGYLLHDQFDMATSVIEEGPADIPAVEYSIPEVTPDLKETEAVAEAPVIQQPVKQPIRRPAPKTQDQIDIQKLELVRDIPMDVTVVLGSTRLPLGMLFSLDKGGIVELDCSENDPVEIMANDRLLARGEVVLMNDQLGVRITEIQFEEVIESYGI
jgi:flagellar motor switch protein FliN